MQTVSAAFPVTAAAVTAQAMVSVVALRSLGRGRWLSSFLLPCRGSLRGWRSAGCAGVGKFPWRGRGRGSSADQHHPQVLLSSQARLLARIISHGRVALVSCGCLLIVWCCLHVHPSAPGVDVESCSFHCSLVWSGACLLGHCPQIRCKKPFKWPKKQTEGQTW